jgi:hypothetical protein
MNPATPAFVAAAIFAVAATLMTAPPPKEVTELYDHVNGPDWVEAGELMAEPEGI